MLFERQGSGGILAMNLADIQPTILQEKARVVRPFWVCLNLVAGGVICCVIASTLCLCLSNMLRSTSLDTPLLTSR